MERLASGKVSSTALRRENGFCSQLPLKDFRIAAIGKRLVKDIK
jgi:hypothetical protein